MIQISKKITTGLTAGKGSIEPVNEGDDFWRGRRQENKMLSPGYIRVVYFILINKM
jgi:hypothetical protein